MLQKASLNDLVNHSPLPAAVQDAARDTATADDDRQHNKQKEGNNDCYHNTNYDSLQVIHYVRYIYENQWKEVITLIYNICTNIECSTLCPNTWLYIWPCSGLV